MAITIKNTFFDIIEEIPGETSARRRSTSVPRAFKPGGGSDDDLDVMLPHGASQPASDDSTSASDNEAFDPFQNGLSDTDTQDCVRDCYDRTNDLTPTAEATLKSKVTLSLAEMVSGKKEGAPPRSMQFCSRSKLRSSAALFQSVREPPVEVQRIIEQAAEVLRSGQDVQHVQVKDGGMGGTTIIAAQCGSAMPDASWIFPLVKDALLSSAEQSENTYIMGYNARPFNNLDALSFSFNIGCVPAAHQNTACWDTYEKGYCPRCSSCRWDHPTEADMMKVIVLLKHPIRQWI